MSQRAVQRRLVEVNQRLVRAREDLAVLEEQLLVFNDTADDTRVQALLAETPLANHDWNAARRHAEAMQRGREAARARVAELERSQDNLLAQLVF
jgi:hypothetical protein